MLQDVELLSCRADARWAFQDNRTLADGKERVMLQNGSSTEENKPLLYLIVYICPPVIPISIFAISHIAMISKCIDHCRSAVLLAKITPPFSRVLPATGVVAMPASTSFWIRVKSMPSQPLATMKSMVTGRTSTWFVTVELYLACPIGTTKSGASEKGLTRPTLNPAGGRGGERSCP